jgi:hypothetical protein
VSLGKKWTLRADGIKVPKVEGVQSSQATGGSDMNRIVVGVDIAKRVFVRPVSRLSFCFTGVMAR